MAEKIAREQEHLEALSYLTLATPSRTESSVRFVNSLSPSERNDLLTLADSHHVVIRALTALQQHPAVSPEVKAWTTAALAKENARISNAVNFIERITQNLEANGCPVVVMKTLDHWPDLGNDIDMYSTADDSKICEVMQKTFNAHIEPRSWGDRLAHKWNFAIVGLPEAVEIHVQRLGQTGEHTALARRFVTKRVPKIYGGRSFYVPAPEERIVVATLQRMYRHFYFRICDIANSSAIFESGELDIKELKRIGEYAGIWPGIATYLMIVSDLMQRYRGIGLQLPKVVTDAARFGGKEIKVNASFLRVPIVPHGMKLYTEQITATAFRGDVPATFRLGLLPPLASAAAISYKLTGSDKGIW